MKKSTKKATKITPYCQHFITNSIAMTTSTNTKMSSPVFYRNFNVEPLYAVRAEGNYIYLKDGRKLLDGFDETAVAAIGHGDKRVIAGIVDQLQTVAFAHSLIFTQTVSQTIIVILIRDVNFTFRFQKTRNSKICRNEFLK